MKPLLLHKSPASKFLIPGVAFILLVLVFAHPGSAKLNYQVVLGSFERLPSSKDVDNTTPNNSHNQTQIKAGVVSETDTSCKDVGYDLCR